LCVGAAATQLTVSPSGSGTWISSNTAVATVSATGLVAVVGVGTTNIEFTNAAGCKKAEVFTVNALPTITSNTGSFTVCQGTSTLDLGSLSPPSTTVAAWVSSDVSKATVDVNGVVTGVASGTAVITYTNVNGCTTTQTVTIDALPTIISNTGSFTVCQGTSTLDLGSLSPPSTTVAPWVSSDVSKATVDVNGLVTGVASGTAVITYTNVNGCKTIQTITVVGSSTISGIFSLCVGAAATQLTVSPSGSGTWISSNTAVATVSATGLVAVVGVGTTNIEFTNAAGCKKAEVFTVNALPAIISNTGSFTVCQGTSTLDLGSLSPPSTTVAPWVSSDVSKATVDVNGLVTGVASGTAVITYTNVNGCTTTQTVTINSLPTISGILSVCKGESRQLTASSAGTWVSSNVSIANVSSAGLVSGVDSGTVTITFTNTNGCIKTETITVTPLPVITGLLNVCVGSTITLSSLSSPSSTLSWTSSDTSKATVNSVGVVTGVASGSVDISYTNSGGCKSKVTVTINPSPNLIIVKNPDAVCAPSTVSITDAALTAGSDFGVYSYFDTDGTTTLNNATAIATSGVYYIVLTNNGCPTKKPITVTINPLPIVSLDQNGFVCVNTTGATLPGSNYTLDTGLSTLQYNFVWYNDTVSTTLALVGETNSELLVDKPGNYRVVVENKATTCKNEARATIVTSLPPDTIQFVTSSFFADDKVITVNVSPVSAYEYQLNNGIFQDSNVFTGVNSGINKVVVRDKYGCGEKEDTVRLLDFPKFFTPNGDGFNDTWNISDISEQFNAKIYIFDRYGKLLKQIIPTGKGWDGTINGTGLPADDYWFTVEYNEAQITKTFKAHFSLKR
jgi:gliding motility-associated-like protein